MSIRQMTFEEGQALNIRTCPKLPPKNTTAEELKKLMADESVKIVKSGKSYFDVATRPEIFEQARDDFKLEELTKIDQRDLRQADVTPAFAETDDTDPMAALFKNTSQEEEEQVEEYERKTYYLRLDQIVSLEHLCLLEGKDISEMIRELIDIGITDKSTARGVDFRAEAERILLEQPRKPKKRRIRKKS